MQLLTLNHRRLSYQIKKAQGLKDLN